MVVVHIANQIIKAGIRLYATGPKFWGGRGYKQGYRQSIDHIVWIGGAVAESSKYQSTGDELDAIQTQPQKPTSSVFIKTRGRRKRYAYCRHTNQQQSYGRRPNSRSYNSFSNYDRR